VVLVSESTGFDGLDDAVGPFPGPAPIQKLTHLPVNMWPTQTASTFWVEFSGPKTNGRCMHGGPFSTMEEATAFAAKHGGYKRAPFDGWVQVWDAQGKLMMVT